MGIKLLDLQWLLSAYNERGGLMEKNVYLLRVREKQSQEER